MLANFFGKSKPVNFIVLFALFLCYFLIGIFFKEFSINLFKELAWFIVLFAVYNFIIAKNQLTFDNSFAFLFLVLLIGFFRDTIAINTTFYASLTVLLFLRKVYSLQTNKKTFHKLFDGGLWLGISFLIEPYTAFFTVLLYASIYLHQRFTYQTLLIPVVGFIAPVLLYFTYCFWYDNTADFLALFQWKYAFDISFYSQSKFVFSIVFISVFLLISLLLKTPKTLAISNKFKRSWILILIHLSISVLVLLLTEDKTGTEFLYVLFPVSIILANGLELFQKTIYADVILLLFLLASFGEFLL